MNYLMHVDDAIESSIQGEVIGLVLDEISETGDKWERIYWVAWKREEQCGTHRVAINSDGESMVTWGCYFVAGTPAQRYVKALDDLAERAGLSGVKA